MSTTTAEKPTTTAAATAYPPDDPLRAVALDAVLALITHLTETPPAAEGVPAKEVPE
jgi:hypothetical protein